jgi:hypothetical protein
MEHIPPQHTIRDLFGALDGIAFQTNLLTLHASPADVHHLAQRCGASARDLKALIQAASSAAQARGTQPLPLDCERASDDVHS